MWSGIWVSGSSLYYFLSLFYCFVDRAKWTINNNHIRWMHIFICNILLTTNNVTFCMFVQMKHLALKHLRVSYSWDLSVNSYNNNLNHVRQHSNVQCRRAPFCFLGFNAISTFSQFFVKVSIYLYTCTHYSYVVSNGNWHITLCNGMASNPATTTPNDSPTVVTPMLKLRYWSGTSLVIRLNVLT